MERYLKNIRFRPLRSETDDDKRKEIEDGDFIFFDIDFL